MQHYAAFYAEYASGKSSHMNQQPTDGRRFRGDDGSTSLSWQSAASAVLAVADAEPHSLALSHPASCLVSRASCCCRGGANEATGARRLRL